MLIGRRAASSCPCIWNAPSRTWMTCLPSTARRANRTSRSPIAMRYGRNARPHWSTSYIRCCLLCKQGIILPQSVAGKAINYTLKRRAELTRFLDHPIIELSTN